MFPRLAERFVGLQRQIGCHQSLCGPRYIILFVVVQYNDSEFQQPVIVEKSPSTPIASSLRRLAARIRDC
jgi:hypothetical protein